MKRFAMVAVVLTGLSTAALADDKGAKAFVNDLIKDDPAIAADELFSITGNFGPAKDTSIVVYWNIMKSGSYEGMAVVPDGSAYKKVAIAALPKNVTSGNIHAYAINVDKDPEDEIVLGLNVSHAYASEAGGYTASSFEYVVLDWSGKRFARVPGLEQKLATALDKQKKAGGEDTLTEATVRATLGVK